MSGKIRGLEIYLTYDTIDPADDSSNYSVDFQYHPKPVYSFIKRTFDLIVSLFCIILLLIPFLIISLIIIIDDKSAPPIFVQKRVGKNGKLFNIYKFRTMCADAYSR